MLKVFEGAIRLIIHVIDSTFSHVSFMVSVIKLAYIFPVIFGSKVLKFLTMQMASKKQLLGGTSATVSLIVDHQVLVGNVGDSKALLCS